MMDEATLAAIEATDFPALQRIIDGHCQTRDWEALDRLRLHCRHALERGKQLWGVEEHIRYRLTLEAPGDIAAAVVGEGPARFTLGPLTEVAASSHSWAELEPWLDPSPWRDTVAHERVMRGEDLSGWDAAVFDIPLQIQSWEPRYPLAEYKADRVEQASPTMPPTTIQTLGPPGRPADEHESEEALHAVTAVWVEQSSGRCETRVVEGDAGSAIAAFGLREAGMARVEPSDALAWLGWAGSVGGRHGRRRGAAAGRFSAWWAVAHLAAVDWPVEPEELGSAIGELTWYLWSDGSTGGWRLNLAVEDPDHGLAWAIASVDTDDD